LQEVGERCREKALTELQPDEGKREKRMFFPETEGWRLYVQKGIELEGLHERGERKKGIAKIGILIKKERKKSRCGSSEVRNLQGGRSEEPDC